MAWLQTGDPETEAESRAAPETADIETSSDGYAQRFSGPVGRWFLRVQAEATLRLLAPYPGARVLDVGGGHGQLAGVLADHGYRVTVLGSAEVCRQRIQPLVAAGRCAFDVGSVVDLPYPDRAFDVVISFRLLPHVNRWRRLLSELTRVAVRGVIVDYPAVRSLNYLGPGLFGLKKHLEGNTRQYLSFREDELLAVFAAAGFRPSGRYPQFFWPIVLHRVLKQPGLSAAAEGLCRRLGLTGALGSPVIIRVSRQEIGA
ncbi:MAG: class I SAM-dependent methyltransferase [Chloroflexota bacterium]